jgi:hypothetical protein
VTPRAGTDRRQRHSSATVAEAQRLHAAGWSVYGIAKLLRRRGTSVDETTIAEWVDPALAERRRREQALRYRIRNARKTGGRLGAGPPRSPEFRLERIRSLDKAGVSAEAIAKVMTFDFPNEPITGHMVRHALRAGEPPRVYRDAVARRKKPLARHEPVAA